jgi:threonylcarbamoyladenosine tRNA methylthiotransferase MtaB
MAEVDLVIGNTEKMRADTWAASPPTSSGDTEPVQVDDIMSVTETAGHLIDGFGTRSRAYVQVQNGCDHRCTFCIIPYGRGNSRSVPAGVVVDQIKRLVDRGYNEVVLTGVDLTSWGADLPGTPRLGDLVMRILKLVPDLPRLRISSIDRSRPTTPDARHRQRVAPDAASAPVAAAWRRPDPEAHETPPPARRRHPLLRPRPARLRPDMTFGADIIAGFPTETEAMFDASLRLVEECGLTWLHVFPYSPRPGTPAARMPAGGWAR